MFVESFGWAMTDSELGRLPLVCLILAILSVMTTSSRMIFAFAR